MIFTMSCPYKMKNARTRRFSHLVWVGYLGYLKKYLNKFKGVFKTIKGGLA